MATVVVEVEDRIKILGGGEGSPVVRIEVGEVLRLIREEQARGRAGEVENVKGETGGRQRAV